METVAVFRLPASPGIVRAGCREPQIPLLFPDYKLLPREWPPIDMYNYLSNYLWHFNISLFNFFPNIFFDIRYGYALFPDKTLDQDELSYDTDALSINIAGTDYTSTWTPVEKVFTATKRTTTGFNSQCKLDVSGTKIYYIYMERVHGGEGDNAIWAASLNTDGTSWSTTQKRTHATATFPYRPNIQVSGTTIYYSWTELVGNYYQIFTATMETDGTGWSATQRTTSNTSKRYHKMRLSGTKLYYAWWQDTDDIGIWTASMDTDGSNWSASFQEANVFTTLVPHFQVSGTKIYYIWEGPNDELWTATMDTDGSNWAATQRRVSATGVFPSTSIGLVVSGSIIYYAWLEKDGSAIYQVWTASMGTDGSGWAATKQTSLATAVNTVEATLWVVNSIIHYVFISDSNTEFYTAEMNIDGTGWTATKRIDTAYTKAHNDQEVVSSSHYYVWAEKDDNSKYQIWTGSLK